MTTDFEALRREAIKRGMRDYERGVSLQDNPYEGAATDEPECWAEGWNNALELDDSE